jgi:hypothetical protein
MATAMKRNQGFRTSRLTLPLQPAGHAAAAVAEDLRRETAS